MIKSFFYYLPILIKEADPYIIKKDHLKRWSGLIKSPLYIVFFAKRSKIILWCFTNDKALVDRPGLLINAYIRLSKDNRDTLISIDLHYLNVTL